MRHSVYCWCGLVLRYPIHLTRVLYHTIRISLDCGEGPIKAVCCGFTIDVPGYYVDLSINRFVATHLDRLSSTEPGSNRMRLILHTTNLNPRFTSNRDPRSMTAEDPDPKTFKSWEDAFRYPIPMVRRMEQQLRKDIATNREKLRTIVE